MFDDVAVAARTGAPVQLPLKKFVPKA